MTPTNAAGVEEFKSYGHAVLSQLFEAFFDTAQPRVPAGRHDRHDPNDRCAAPLLVKDIES
ncbi:hypothetical protein E4P82_18885 [Candidatus Competibacter phosphatis]|uniref:Uncharacterized protein n=1 Tax=Candidatus Competibacter phosphatis TaxID=221280 RepID=A0ABX1TQX9_9GAMM|nr:hypothetical protein [Candidatus Competibacter phosphatis]NMQ21077.1 hypothetical protein [Candidatus Competibacter phosphatis]